MLEFPMTSYPRPTGHLPRHVRRTLVAPLVLPALVGAAVLLLLAAHVARAVFG
jgi:hypothetical protein